MKQLLEVAPVKLKAQIRQNIKTLSYGIKGEDTIAFELKNSHMPMYVLHDLYLTDNNLTAQIDYLIITRKVTFLIECKNLIGNIEINSDGDFIRTINYNGKYQKEGIYSPITQNQHHLALLKKLRSYSKNNFISKIIFEKYFDESYHSVVVLANPKTILNSKYAKGEVKNNVIRADQLINYIQTVNKLSTLEPSSDKQMEQLATFYLKLHSQNQVDYTKKYQIKQESAAPTPVEKQPPQEIVKQNTAISPSTSNNSANEELTKELKAYRLKTAKEQKLKPYWIFSDSQLQNLIAVMPSSIEQLLSLSGFGEVKCNKYENDILEILNKYC